MRAGVILLAIAVATPVLVGCLGDQGEDLGSSEAGELGDPLELTHVPPGATVQRLDNGLALLWNQTSLPFEEDIPVPEGTTMVRVTGEVASGQGLFVHLSHADTGRRRCNVPYYDVGWFTANTGTMSCSGLAVVDPLPTNWTATVQGPEQAKLVKVELLQVPLDGIAGQVDIDQLSMPIHELQETEETTFQGEDGTELYAEVTLPQGDGPWPTILASSPYNSPAHAAGETAMWEYFVHDWAKRGYAVVVADVRGTGRSDGCMEVWGPNEQSDQVVLVEWAASQDWSDGSIGFYGQSYVGTTPVEAAVNAPEALKAIIAVAPVNNAYEDWHFGGVSNGENLLSPVFYQASTGGVSDLEENDPVRSAIQVANGVCDPTLVARANDPRALYDEFYEVRNFTKRAGSIQAAVLYTHGFEDVNVKSAMGVPFFNDLDVPKLALLGHWVHQHPVRADNELLFLAWMDHHVKGKDMGLDQLPNVDVVTGDGKHRTDDAWPPTDPENQNLFPDFGKGQLTPQPTDGSASIVLDPAGAFTAQEAVQAPAQEVLERELNSPLQLAGKATLHLRATLQGGDNAQVAAFLFDVGDGEEKLITFGMANLAHRNGHDTYDPVPPGETVAMGLPFLPTEHVFQPGHTLKIVIRSAQTQDWSAVGADRTGTLTLWGGDDGTKLVLPTVDPGLGEPLPVTASN